ncbi:response regulator [Edaphobacter aggregans]|uniref:response regulator n=1 Tax=Edaphobacter aggregans TaxID=570835 RepID=UPI0005555729|nr:response regulator [Edaphobacter aggregans]
MQATPQRILIVDDDPMVADTLTLIFQKKGFDVRTCNSAEDGLECARVFRPDLLLCDIIMPGRGGLNLVADITRELPSCRILVLTGFYADLGAVEKHSRKLPRPLGILTKPCQPSLLLREANAMLASA